MTDDTRFGKLAEIVLEARALPPEDRDAFLKEACTGDPELHVAALRLAQVPTAAAERLEHFNPFAEVERPQLEPGAVFDKYRIERKLGDGGMSTVYLARSIRSNHPVALKFLSPSGLRFSAEEHTLLGELSHDNIARLFYSDVTEDDIPYLVMEYVEGEQIAKYCESRALSLDDRLNLFRLVCKGIQHAHSAPIVHRDIKPDNILVTDEGVPKILDFGIARALPADLKAVTLTQAEFAPMTLAFASPEQVLRKHTGIPSDIYSLGVLLCVLLTGRLPYRVRTIGDLYTAIPTQEPTRPSELLQAPRKENPTGELHYPYFGPAPPPGEVRHLRKRLEGDLDAIALKALRKEPETRYQTVAELAADIGRYLVHQPVTARKDSKIYRIAKFLGKYRWAALALSSIILGLLVYTSILLKQRQEITRQRDRARAEAERALQTITFVKGMFESTDPLVQANPNIRAIDLLTRAADDLRRNKGMPPALKASLLSTVGELLNNHGFYSQADSILKEAIQIQSKEPIEDPLELALSLGRLGSVYNGLGKYKEGAKVLEESLAIFRDYPGGPPIEVISTISSLGAIKLRLGEYTAAESLFRRAIELHRKKIPSETQHLAIALHALAQVLSERGDSVSADAHYREALGIMQRLYGARSFQAATVLEGMAIFYYKRGNYSRAEAILRTVVRIATERLGPDHPYVLGSLHNLAGVLAAEGKFDEALSLHQKVFAERRRTLGLDHLSTIRSLAQIGSTLASRGDLTAAERSVREALEQKRRLLPKEHPEIAASINNLAFILQERGDLEGADKQYLIALSIYKRLYGENHGSVAMILGNRATIALALGRLSEAESLCRRALAISRGLYKGEHIGVASNLNDLATVLIEQGRYKEAAAILNDSLALAERIDANGLIVGSIKLLQGDLYTKSKSGNCEIPSRDGLAILLTKLSSDNWRIADAQSTLGGCLASIGKYTEAERLLNRSLSALREAKGAHSRSTILAARRLVSLYESLGKPAKAAEYRRLFTVSTPRAATSARSFSYR